MKIFFWCLIAAMAVVSVVGSAWLLLKREQKPIDSFEVSSVFRADIIKKTVSTGTILPRKEIEVKSNISGIVSDIFVKPGDKVLSGQVLAKLRIIPDALALSQADSALKLAELALKESEELLVRQKALFDLSLISKADFRESSLQVERRRQELDAARARLEVVREGASNKSGSFATQVYATVSGMILDVPVKQGTFVIESNTFNSGTTIAQIANMSEMVFEGRIDEAEVGALKEGMPLELTVGALRDRLFRARLEFIAPKGVREEGAIYFPLRAAIEIPDGVFLRAGYSANAEIILDSRTQVLALKERDLEFEAGKTFVNVQAKSGFERREVQTGLSDGIQVEILSGLSETELIRNL